MRIDPSLLHLSTPPRGFLVVDGVNGAGKSTFLRAVSRFLANRGFVVCETREPGADTPLGRAARQLLLNPSPEEKLSPTAELFLFAADRAEHVNKIILPALDDGQLVLSDRYYYSTLAFQGYGRGLDRDLLDRVVQAAVGEAVPDLVFLLDLDAEEGLRRAKRRGFDGEEDGFERERLHFHRRIRQGFLEVAESCSEPVCVLDASADPEHVFAEALPALQHWIEALQNH